MAFDRSIFPAPRRQEFGINGQYGDGKRDTIGKGYVDLNKIALRSW